MKKLFFFIIFIGMAAFIPHSNSAVALESKIISPISITDAVVYVPLGNSHSTTAFFTLKNNTNNTIVITTIASAAVKKIELVPSVAAKSSNTEKSSVANNDPSPWAVAPGQSLVLHPGHQYLQLNGLKSSLATGDELHLEISLGNGKKVIAVARAKSAFDQIHGH